GNARRDGWAACCGCAPATSPGEGSVMQWRAKASSIFEHTFEQINLVGRVAALKPKLAERHTRSRPKTLTHDVDGFGILVHQKELPTQLQGCRTGRSTSGKEVEHPVASLTARLDDPPQDPERLLRGVA